MEIDIATVVRRYSANKDAYRAVVRSTSASSGKIDDLFREKKNYELSIESDERVIKEWESRSPAIVEQRTKIKEKGQEYLDRINAEIKAYMDELSLKAGDVVTLKGAIEIGMPLNLVDSKGNKIVTNPVIYIKIEK